MQHQEGEIKFVSGHAPEQLALTIRPPRLFIRTELFAMLQSGGEPMTADVSTSKASEGWTTAASCQQPCWEMPVLGHVKNYRLSSCYPTAVAEGWRAWLRKENNSLLVGSYRWLYRYHDLTMHDMLFGLLQPWPARLGDGDAVIPHLVIPVLSKAIYIPDNWLF
jgi:hypothetical protein